MKVLAIAPNLHMGGAQRMALLLSGAWSAAGHDVALAVFDGRAPQYPVGVRLIALDQPARRGPVAKAMQLLARAAALARLIRAERPDRLFSFTESANLPATLACAMTGTLDRLFVSVRDDPASFPPALRRLLPLFYRFPARTVAISPGVERALAAMGVPPGRLVTITNALDAAMVEDGARAPLPPERRGRPYVLAAGRLARQKGFDMLLEAYAAIAPDAELVILGEGAERPALEAQARALGLAGRVHLPGAVANPFVYMAHASLFVLSSRHEGWGNVLMEAMATGCPVVTFDCPHGPADMVGDCGLIVPPGDVSALASAMRALLDDPARRARLAEAGRARSRTFDLAPTAARWLALTP